MTVGELRKALDGLDSEAEILAHAEISPQRATAAREYLLKMVEELGKPTAIRFSAFLGPYSIKCLTVSDTFCLEVDLESPRFPDSDLQPIQ
jgi:hypothetical protein